MAQTYSVTVASKVRRVATPFSGPFLGGRIDKEQRAYIGLNEAAFDSMLHDGARDAETLWRALQHANAMFATGNFVRISERTDELVKAQRAFNRLQESSKLGWADHIAAAKEKCVTALARFHDLSAM